MAQSVKLSDGSYIDASAVYDTDRQETVEDALKCSYLALGPYIAAKGYSYQGPSSFAIRQGHLVMLSINACAGSSATAANTVWCTLPEEYRPSKTTSSGSLCFCGQELMGTRTNLYCKILASGDVVTYTSVPAGSWWAANITYWVD